MQSYPLRLAAGGAQSFNTSARRFVYESGMTVPAGSDPRIVVKPDSGNEIVLRPGQAFALEGEQLASTWHVRPYMPGLPIEGMIIIGSGLFDDSSLKLDPTSGAMSVVPVGGFQVANTAANRVPVSLDTKQVLKMEAPVVRYTHSYNNPAQGAQTRPLVTSAENTHGLILEFATGTSWQIVAKATTPTSAYDAEVLVPNISAYKVGERFYVAPGKGLWLIAGSGPQPVFIAWTLLNAETA